MGRLIDADEYEKRIKPYDTEDIMDKALYNFAHNKLISTPTARPQGRWETAPDRTVHQTFDECKCSACGAVEYFNKGWKKFNYCPNCGAEMEDLDG